ncbi:hypothetical protein Adt_35335 [Abeliophyllum distichum]|uniref:Uncharacterized protein n=1 Tax=Abeliophyllum distichum TaxID=126358 RepID=A0ABD1QFC5_9LAMI
MSQDLVEAEINIIALTKKLDDTLNAQAITFAVLEKANEEKKALQLSSQAKISTLRTNFEASTMSRSDAEGAYVNLLAEKKMLKEKFAGVDVEFTTNFHNTEAYANFSAFFASGGQQEVITVLCNDFSDLDIAFLEDKIFYRAG